MSLTTRKAYTKKLETTRSMALSLAGRLRAHAADLDADGQAQAAAYARQAAALARHSAQLTDGVKQLRHLD